MKITAVRMSKAGWLPKLVSKLYLQRDRILVFLAAFLIAGSNISGAVPLGAAYYAASRGAEVPWLLTGAAVILEICSMDLLNSYL